MGTRLTPSFAEEKRLEKQGYRLIAGIDEVGRGALAGPVVAAAVVLPRRLRTPWLSRVKDSKLLSPQARESLDIGIRQVAIAVGIGSVPSNIIDTRGIAWATRLAMMMAIDRLSPPAEALLIDYFLLPDVKLPQKGVKDGDSLCFCIACASIVAKVARDRLMLEMDSVHPGYGLAEHKGYGTAGHLSCLRRLGPSPIHRRSFSPVRDVMNVNGNLSP